MSTSDIIRDSLINPYQKVWVVNIGTLYVEKIRYGIMMGTDVFIGIVDDDLTSSEE